MNWLQKIAQIPATNLPAQLWYHGTDAATAYSLMENMQLKPREETGNTSYVGSISSIQSSVYLTASPGKAAKHAIETAESYKSHPVILVIEPASLGYVHVDEDMVHMILNGQSHFDNDWYPSPALEQEIFRFAAESLRLDDYEENKSDKKLVLEYLYEKKQSWSDDYVEDEYLQEEGIVPDDQGNYEYDESMHLAKEIAATLNDDHQKEAVMNFGSMAHEGRVQASEIYLIPWKIDRGDWQDSPTSLQSYDELQQFGTRINPQQLLMSFMYKDSANWLQKISSDLPKPETYFLANKYPIAGEIVSGLKVLNEIDNISSVRATIRFPIFLEDIREVPFSDFSAPPVINERTLYLSEEIKQNGYIMPLIVCFEEEGPWILEGGHRYDALQILKVQSFPAMVVVDAEYNL